MLAVILAVLLAWSREVRCAMIAFMVSKRLEINVQELTDVEFACEAIGNPQDSGCLQATLLQWICHGSEDLPNISETKQTHLLVELRQRKARTRERRR